jgi:chitinase
MKHSHDRGFHPLTAIVAATALFTITPAFAQTNLVVDDAYISANGNLITGDYSGTTTTPAILVTTAAPVIILNSTIETTGDFIVGQNGNDITVVNCTAIADNPNVRGTQKGIFLRVTNPVNISVRNNIIQGARIGLYVNGYSGNHTHNQTIRVIGNNFLNIDGRPSDGKSSFAESGQYNGQAVHIGNAYGVPDMEYAWNQVVNQPNESATGAIFEFSESGGTAASPAIVHDNFIQGAYPAAPGTDLYGFGGLLIDGAKTDTATTTSAFINVYQNQIVSTANYGMAITAGHDINFTNNRVISSGYTAAGVFYPMSSYYGAAYGAYNINLLNLPATVFFNNNISNSGSAAPNGKGTPVRADWSLPGQGGSVEGNLDFSPNAASSPTATDEDNELVAFQAKFNTYAVGHGLRVK